MGRNHKIEIFMANNVSYRHCCPLFLVQNLGWNFSLEFRMLFCGRRKMGGPGANPSEHGQEPPKKLNPHMTPSLGIEPGPQWWEANTLTAALCLLP